MIKNQRILLKSLVMGSLFCAPLSQAQTPEEVEEYWPCVQRYVDELYADIYWPEAATITKEQWQNDAVIRTSASVLADEYSAAESINDAITAVKEKHKGDEQKGMPQLFAATVDALNAERKDYLKAIISREKGQVERAKELEDTLNKIDQIQAREQAGQVVEGAERIDDLNIDLEWEQRIFQQRNDQIQAMCELPVEIEERVSSIAQVLREQAE